MDNLSYESKERTEGEGTNGHKSVYSNYARDLINAYRSVNVPIILYSFIHLTLTRESFEKIFM